MRQLSHDSDDVSPEPNVRRTYRSSGLVLICSHSRFRVPLAVILAIFVCSGRAQSQFGLDRLPNGIKASLIEPMLWGKTDKLPEGRSECTSRVRWRQTAASSRFVLVALCFSNAIVRADADNGWVANKIGNWSRQFPATPDPVEEL
jgi:hypothetical protein